MTAPLSASPLRNLEKLQGQLPPHLARAALAELSVLMRYAERGAWAFAVYNTVPVRDEVAAVLKELLAPLPVYQISLSTETPNPLERIEACVPADQERAIVFFFDLEQSGAATWRALEMERENLAARSLGLVFWINRPARAEGVQTAPNFWSQRGGVFDFTIESAPVVAEVRGAWAGQPVQIKNREDAERQLRLFGGLLREYEAEEGTPSVTLADLHGKVAYLLKFFDRYDESAGQLQQQLALARQTKDLNRQVEALNNLGWIAQMQQGRQAALSWYEQALELAANVPGSRAESLQNIATVLHQEGEAGRALELLTESLNLFRQVGDRLGEANTLKAIGDVYNFQKELKEALASYEAALGLFRQVGDRLGEANTLKAIGDVQRFQDENKEALASYEAALGLFRQVGDRLGEANTLQAIGNMKLDQNEGETGLKLLQQALELYQTIGDRSG